MTKFCKEAKTIIVVDIWSNSTTFITLRLLFIDRGVYNKESKLALELSRNRGFSDISIPTQAKSCDFF